MNYYWEIELWKCHESDAYRERREFRSPATGSEFPPINVFSSINPRRPPAWRLIYSDDMRIDLISKDNEIGAWMPFIVEKDFSGPAAYNSSYPLGLLHVPTEMRAMVLVPISAID